MRPRLRLAWRTESGVMWYPSQALSIPTVVSSEGHSDHDPLHVKSGRLSSSCHLVTWPRCISLLLVGGSRVCFVGGADSSCTAMLSRRMHHSHSRGCGFQSSSIWCLYSGTLLNLPASLAICSLVVFSCAQPREGILFPVCPEALCFACSNSTQLNSISGGQTQ
eukprot:2371086-Amphidinium_carterae.1